MIEVIIIHIWLYKNVYFKKIEEVKLKLKV